MIHKPERVTFTGIDERTDLARAVVIGEKYPVEWGVLFSITNTGLANRYPAWKVIERFERLRLSAHICGRYCRDLMISLVVDVELAGFLRRRGFERAQINLKDGETDVHHVRVDAAEEFGRRVGAKRAILQCRGPFPVDSRVDWLFDRSGGAGLRETSWPAGVERVGAAHVACGYAGGIGPDTIAADLAAIAAAAGSAPYWIDMESMVRTGDWLDLDKCERVLEVVYA